MTRSLTQELYAFVDHSVKNPNLRKLMHFGVSVHERYHPKRDIKIPIPSENTRQATLQKTLEVILEAMSVEQQNPPRRIFHPVHIVSLVHRFGNRWELHLVVSEGVHAQ